MEEARLREWKAKADMIDHFIKMKNSMETDINL
jgi:hypothetical protein